MRFRKYKRLFVPFIELYKNNKQKKTNSFVSGSRSVINFRLLNSKLPLKDTCIFRQQSSNTTHISLIMRSTQNYNFSLFVHTKTGGSISTQKLVFLQWRVAVAFVRIWIFPANSLLNVIIYFQCMCCRGNSNNLRFVQLIYMVINSHTVIISLNNYSHFISKDFSFT